MGKKDEGQKFACDFGAVSYAASARVGIKLFTGGDNPMTVAAAGKLLDRREIRVRMVGDPNAGGDAEGQEKMDIDDNIVVEAIARSKRYAKSGKEITCSLLIDRSTVKAEKLVRLAKTRGTITITKIGDLKNGESGQPD